VKSTIFLDRFSEIYLKSKKLMNIGTYYQGKKIFQCDKNSIKGDAFFPDILYIQ